MARLSLRFDLDGCGECWFTGTLDTADFAATARFWMPAYELEDLPAQLATYPIPRDPGIGDSWYDECLTIRISQTDATGHLRARVAIREFTNTWNRCQAEFQTSYADVDRFRSEIEQLVRAGEGEAVLNGA